LPGWWVVAGLGSEFADRAGAEPSTPAERATACNLSSGGGGRPLDVDFAGRGGYAGRGGFDGEAGGRAARLVRPRWGRRTREPCAGVDVSASACRQPSGICDHVPASRRTQGCVGVSAAIGLRCPRDRFCSDPCPLGCGARRAGRHRRRRPGEAQGVRAVARPARRPAAGAHFPPSVKPGATE
jgi:hypothetical protein